MRKEYRERFTGRSSNLKNRLCDLLPLEEYEVDWYNEHHSTVGYTHKRFELRKTDITFEALEYIRGFINNPECKPDGEVDRLMMINKLHGEIEELRKTILKYKEDKKLLMMELNKAKAENHELKTRLQNIALSLGRNI